MNHATLGRRESAGINEILSELMEQHPQFVKSANGFENACRGVYESLRNKGIPEEDITQIMMLTDWEYELLNACADAIAEVLIGPNTQVTLRIPDNPTMKQALYLEMMKALYQTVSGCTWGLEGSRQSETNNKA